MPTLLLSRRYTEDSIQLWRVATRLGWEVLRLDVAEAARYAGPVDAVYAGTTFVDVLQAARGDLRFLAPDPLVLTRLPPELLLRRVRAATLGAVRAASGRRHLKPVRDKLFDARVVDPALEPVGGDCPDDEPVLDAEVVDFDLEVRAFVQDGEVRTSSVYARDGVLAVETPDAATKEATEALVRRLWAVAPQPPCVIDLGRVRGQGWAVVEANAAWGSGLYACDPEEAFGVIRAAVACAEGSGSAAP